MVRPASRLSNAGSQEDLGGQNTLGDQAAGAMAPATAGVEAGLEDREGPYDPVLSDSNALGCCSCGSCCQRRECQRCCCRAVGH